MTTTTLGTEIADFLERSLHEEHTFGSFNANFNPMEQKIQICKCLPDF